MKTMNLNKDLIAKAKWVASLMRADGVKPEQVTTELAMAYMDAVGKKITMIQETYLTRNGGKEAMQSNILVML